MKRILILGCVLVSFVGQTQQLPQYSQYLRNQYLINPAAAGVYDFKDITIGGRLQWSGFTNAPKTGFIAFSTPLTKKPSVPTYDPGIRVSSPITRNPEIKTGKFKHAVGGQVVMDQYGAFQRLYFGGSYAVHIPISKTYNMSFGTKLGLSNNTFLEDRAVVLNPTTDATYQGYIANANSKFIMDLGLGLYIYSKNAFFGIAADQVTKDFVTFGTSPVNFNSKMHFNLTAGYKFPISENLTLTPAILVKYINPAPTTIEGTVQIEYKEWLWAGISYRNKDAIIGMVGMNINNRFKIGYSYDYSTSRFNQYSSGGHELILGIQLGR